MLSMISTCEIFQTPEILTIEVFAKMFQSYGNKVRYGNKRGGLAWTPIKNLLLKIDSKLKFTQWNQTCKQFYPFMKNELQLYGDTFISPDTKVETNDHSNHLIWEAHHFLLQHGRIVHLSEPSLMRLFQICYNTGQLTAQLEMDKSHYTTEQLDYLDKMCTNDDLIYDIRSYITDTDIADLNNKIKDEEIFKTLLEIVRIMCQVDSLPSK